MRGCGRPSGGQIEHHDVAIGAVLRIRSRPDAPSGDKEQGLIAASATPFRSFPSRPSASGRACRSPLSTRRREVNLGVVERPDRVGDSGMVERKTARRFRTSGRRSRDPLPAGRAPRQRFSIRLATASDTRSGWQRRRSPSRDLSGPPKPDAFEAIASRRARRAASRLGRRCTARNRSFPAGARRRHADGRAEHLQSLGGRTWPRRERRRGRRAGARSASSEGRSRPRSGPCAHR